MMHRFINRCIILTFYVSSDIWSIIPNPQKYLGKALRQFLDSFHPTL